MSETLGNLDQAATYYVRALAIWLKIGTATAQDIQRLTALRRRLGTERFQATALAAGLDEESASTLMNMLDRQDKTTEG